MATTDTQLSQLVINVGTEAQIAAAISAGTITADMLSIATDGSTDVTTDNVTISTNSSDEIQAIGTKNKNTTSGAANVVYDWVGTYAEWVSQNISTTHPEWVCYITDDVVSNTSDVSTLRAHEVIEFQAPTSANGYKWYRKYADGWVEQGGYHAGTTSFAIATIVFPVQMADDKYCLTLTSDVTDSTVFTNTSQITTRGASRPFSFNRSVYGFGCQSYDSVTWEAKGMYA